MSKGVIFDRIKGVSLVPRTRKVVHEKKNNTSQVFPSRKQFDKLLLVLNPDGYPQQKIEIVKRFCRKKHLNLEEIKTNEVSVASKLIRKVSDDFEYLVIMGDEKQFPTYKFTHLGVMAHTDFIYQCDSHLKVGRVLGGTRTITDHLRCCCGDSKLTIVIDTEPNRSENAIIKLEEIGYQVFLWKGVNGQSFKMMEPLLEKAQMIFQYSDGTFKDKVRGNAKEWYGGNPARAFFTYKDLRKIQFTNYPLIFSEACTTANFGPFVRAMSEANAAYIGATCMTYNNKHTADEWELDHSCEGIKYGILNQLNKNGYIGDMLNHVLKSLMESLPPSSKNVLSEIEKGKPLEINNKKVISIIQWILFGNPLRVLNKASKTGSRRRKENKR